MRLIQGDKLCFSLRIPASRLRDVWGHSLPSAPPWRALVAGGAVVRARGVQREAVGGCRGRLVL